MENTVNSDVTVWCYNTTIGTSWTFICTAGIFDLVHYYVAFLLYFYFRDWKLVWVIALFYEVYERIYKIIFNRGITDIDHGLFVLDAFWPILASIQGEILFKYFLNVPRRCPPLAIFWLDIRRCRYSTDVKIILLYLFHFACLIFPLRLMVTSKLLWIWIVYLIWNLLANIVIWYLLPCIIWTENSKQKYSRTAPNRSFSIQWDRMFHKKCWFKIGVIIVHCLILIIITSLRYMPTFFMLLAHTFSLLLIETIIFVCYRLQTTYTSQSYSFIEPNYT